MGDDLDAGGLGAFEQHRLYADFHVQRHEADDGDFLGDQVFQQFHLLGRIDIGGPTIVASMLKSLKPFPELPFSTALNQGMPAILTTVTIVGAAAHATVAVALATPAKAALPISFRVSRLFRGFHYQPRLFGAEQTAY